MNSNIFINDFSNNILYDFLDKYCKLENNYYIIYKDIFKKYEYFNQLEEFYKILKNLYKQINNIIWKEVIVIIIY